MDPWEISAFSSENPTPYGLAEIFPFPLVGNPTREDNPIGVDQIGPSVMSDGEEDETEELSEMMKILKLQDIVPGCKKIESKSSVIEETINYLQSLDAQLEFLSHKLEFVHSKGGPSFGRFSCAKLSHKSWLLDEMIDHIPTLQWQVEFLSMKLALNNPIIATWRGLHQDKFFEEPRAFSSQSRESLHQDGTYEDVGKSSHTGNCFIRMQQKKQTLCTEKVYEPGEAWHVEDVEFSMTAEPYPSCLQGIKSLSRQEGKEDTQVLDPSAHKLLLEDVPQAPNKRLISGIKNANTGINFVNKTFEEVTSETDKNSNADISFESLRRHFGKPQDDAAKSSGVYEPEEGSPVQDVEPATTAELHPSCVQGIKSLSRQEGEEDTGVLDPSAHKLPWEDVSQIPNRRLILAIENASTDIHFIDKACGEVTSETNKNSKEDISFESLTKHFGVPLDDAAKRFGVSRSTFKRICRGHGIKRWQSRKRKIGNNISSKLDRKLNDKVPSKFNFSGSGLPPVQHTVVDDNTIQKMNKMTVKAMYNGIAIRFELPDRSGIAELEDYVIERLQLDRKSFSIKYQDDEGDWTLIACDEDVRECIKLSRSLKKTTIKMLLDSPFNSYAL